MFFLITRTTVYVVHKIEILPNKDIDCVCFYVYSLRSVRLKCYYDFCGALITGLTNKIKL